MYQADKIIKALERLNEDFYPRPADFSFDLEIPFVGRQSATVVESGYLTKDEFLTLYHKCSDVLHVGSLDRWEKNWGRAPNLKEAGEWHAKLYRLLEHHQITLPEKDYELWTTMRNSRGRTHSAIMVKDTV